MNEGINEIVFSCDNIILELPPTDATIERTHQQMVAEDFREPLIESNPDKRRDVYAFTGRHMNTYTHTVSYTFEHGTIN